MNSDRSTSGQSVSPAKLAVIAVLALVLVLVLVFQFWGGGEGTPAILKKRAPRNAANAGETPASDAARATNSNRLHWPDIQLDEVAAFNPFETPAALLDAPVANAVPVQPSQSIQSAQAAGPPQMESAVTTPPIGSKGDDEQARIRAQERKSRIKRIEATAIALRQQGVAMVMTTSTGAVARVGEQEVRVGDVINGVVRVVEITPQGIVVEEAPEELPETNAN